MPESRPLHPTASDRDLVLDLARVVSGQTALQEIPEASWPGIFRLAVRHGLGPLLWWILEQQGMQVSPSVTLDDLKNSARLAAFTYQLMQENQSMIQPALSQAGIPAIWIKGIGLAETLYPQPHLRPLGDLDVLVPYDQRQAALQVIQSIGYHFIPGNALEEKLHPPESCNHHYHLIGGSTGKIILDIHFRLIGDDILLPLNQMDWFLHEREMIGQGQDAFSVLRPEAQFLYLCAHAILQHGEFEFHLLRYYDLHLLANGTRLNWDLLVSRAIELGWSYTVVRALVLTCDYFATPVPQRVFNELKNYRPSDKDYVRARRLQGAGHRWEMRLLRLSEFTWGERMRQLFHLTFPPPQYMRAWYGIPPGRALLPYYIFRWLDAARELMDSALKRFR